MTFNFTRHICTITREPTDKCFRSESDVFYRLRNLMREQGWDVVKRNMVQEGHMMGDKYTFLVRDRKRRFAIFDGDYAIISTHKDLNSEGKVNLGVHWFIDTPTEFEWEVIKAIARGGKCEKSRSSAAEVCCETTTT